MKGFTDIHAHFVYGLDDGARTREEMEAMLDAAWADGVTALVATPHATPGVYPLDEGLLRTRLREAAAYCRSKGYAMRLYAGAELMYTPAMDRFIEEGNIPVLAESDQVLVEFVPDVEYREMEKAVDRMRRMGYDVIIAHMERYGCLFMGKNARKLKEKYQVRYQVNCNSLIQNRGFLRSLQLKRWLKDRLIDFVATDSHNTRNRPTRMRQAHAILKEQCGERYADYLTGLGE